MNNEETIKKLKELKSQFQKIDEGNIKDVDSIEIIKVCSEYFVDANKDITYSNKLLPTKGNLAQAVNQLSNFSNNGHSSEILNVEGIICLLEKKIQSLKTET